MGVFLICDEFTEDKLLFISNDKLCMCTVGGKETLRVTLLFSRYVLTYLGTTVT